MVVVKAEEPAAEVVAGKRAVAAAEAEERTAEVVAGETPIAEVAAGETPVAEVAAGETPAAEEVAGNTPAAVAEVDGHTAIEDVNTAAPARGAPSTTAFRFTVMPPTTVTTAIALITAVVNIGTAVVPPTGVMETAIITAA